MSHAAAPPGATHGLVLEGISKRFPLCDVLGDVSVKVERGSIHGLVGENGAGKSTLMKIAYGMLAPDRGQVEIRGRRLERATPAAAIALGLGMVHQHFMLADALTTWENVVLGEEPVRGGLLDRAAALRGVAELSRRYGLDLDPGRLVGQLGVGEKQRVEIVKVLWRGAEVIILDEPTAVLSPLEVRAFLDVLRELRAAGKTIVLITHKLDEVMAVADAITVLRRGRVVARLDPRATSARAVAEAMVGHALAAPPDPGGAPGPDAPVALGLEQVRLQAGADPIDLTVRAGEIVGVAGVEGNGQTELAELIAGLRPLDAGRIRLGGRELGAASPAARLGAGLGHVPEDRHRRGLLLDFSLEENLLLGRQHELAGRLGLDRRRMRERARTLLGEFDVRGGEPHTPARALSGGNQQKLVIARELTRPGLKLLMALQPTRGVDVEAARQIHERLLAARRAGVGILLISAELGELRALCDRICVLLRGQIVGEVGRAEASEERLGAWMTGASLGEVSHA